MRISLHGGDCCGIKHIHGLGPHPDHGMLCARKARKMTSFGQKLMPAVNDMRSRNPRKNEDFFNEAAPQELPKDRFKRFVKFIKKHRAHGIIETVINTNQKAWEPVFEKHGFKRVSFGQNSNSYQTIFVYHLVY